MWLIDVARELPDALLYGFDNDLKQAPHQNWLPSNVTTRYWNIFEEIPADLVGRFDLVHIRLVVLVVEESDPRPIIGNLLKMLKPGGYL